MVVAVLRPSAAFRAERPDLAEVGDLARPVGNAALETEAEGRGHEVAGLALEALRSVGVDEDGPRKGLPFVGLDAPAARPLLDPVFREAVEDGAVVRRPGVVGAEEEEAGLGVPVLRAVRRLARLVGARRGFVPAADAVVLLPALAAEDEGQEDAAPVARHEPLTVDGDVPLVFRLDGGVDGVAPADELVDPEREGRVARLRVPGKVPGEEPRADRVGAKLFVEPRQGREVARGALVAEDTPGGADPHEPARAFLFRRPESRLEPGGEGMREEPVVVRRKAVARRLYGRSQLGKPRRIVSRARLRGAPQSLPDDRGGHHGRPEEQRGDPRDLGALVRPGAAGGEGGRRADALELRRRHPVADASDEEGDVRPLAPAVGVQLVEDEEPEPLRGVDELLLERPREEELEHDEVREEDVGRVLEDLLPLVFRLLARIPREGDGADAIREALADELAQLARLAVRQGVHRVDDDGLDALAAPAPENVVDDGDDVGEALARAGTGRQDVALALPRCEDRFFLVTVETEPAPFALDLVAVLVAPEDLRTPRVQHAALDEFVDPASRLEGGIQLDEGLGPEQPFVEEPVDVLADAPVPDRDEAADVGRVVGDEVVPVLEDSHSHLLGLAATADGSGPAARWRLRAGREREQSPREGTGRFRLQAILRPSLHCANDAKRSDAAFGAYREASPVRGMRPASTSCTRASKGLAGPASLRSVATRRITARPLCPSLRARIPPRCSARPPSSRSRTRRRPCTRRGRRPCRRG